METTTVVYWGSMEFMEKKIETTTTIELHSTSLVM